MMSVAAALDTASSLLGVVYYERLTVTGKSLPALFMVAEGVWVLRMWLWWNAVWALSRGFLLTSVPIYSIRFGAYVWITHRHTWTRKVGDTSHWFEQAEGIVLAVFHALLLLLCFAVLRVVLRHEESAPRRKHIRLAAVAIVTWSLAYPVAGVATAAAPSWEKTRVAESCLFAFFAAAYLALLYVFLPLESRRVLLVRREEINWSGDPGRVAPVPAADPTTVPADATDIPPARPRSAPSASSLLELGPAAVADVELVAVRVAEDARRPVGGWMHSDFIPVIPPDTKD